MLVCCFYMFVYLYKYAYTKLFVWENSSVRLILVRCIALPIHCIHVMVLELVNVFWSKCYINNRAIVETLHHMQ